MKSYKIVKPREFELVTANDTVCDPNFAKIKILKAGISNSDLALYRSAKNAPIVPCHQAMGVISEIDSETGGFQKSERVYINPYIKCGTCIRCIEGNPQMCERMKRFGTDTDGLLADFAIVPVENLHRLPDIIDKDKSMFIKYVALSKTALDKIKVQKGEHVVILGASKLGAIMAQLVIYYQGIPILIDEDESMLALSREHGVYYTICTKTQDAKKLVKEITGNRMAENVVYIANCRLDIDSATDLVGFNGAVVILGGEKSCFNGSFKPILDKQLRVTGVNNAYESIPAAINLLATKSINVSNMIEENISFAEVPEKFEEWSQKDDFHFQLTVDC